MAPGLYLVATPIGNLEDITLRALRILASVDRIACEDTRQTAKLLGHFGIRTPTVSYHSHNESRRAQELVAQLQAGGRIAVVSDAGMPGISDPGALLVAEAIRIGVSVYPIPGANAALSALIASGLPAESFAFHGFLPSRQGRRRTALESLRPDPALAPASHPSTHIFYETPHRILEALEDVVRIFGPTQPVVLARELTKLHEEILRGSAAQILSTLRARASIRGEMVLLLAAAGTEATNGSEAAAETEAEDPLPAPTRAIPGTQAAPAIQAAPGTSAAPRPTQPVPPTLTIADQVAALMRSESLSQKDALKRVAKSLGIGKSEAYRELQRLRATSR
ncbi:MAG: 16S rRNA (cytidine(1402)-2'-O)-methyltransferase [Acidobacteriaceae bacterium]